MMGKAKVPHDHDVSLGHMPDGKWEFDDSVTACFDDMLERSIPQYGQMRYLATELAKRFGRHNTDIIDLGCSRGGAMAPLIDHFGAACKFWGEEVSDPMLSAVRERFAGMIESGVVKIEKRDLHKSYPGISASVTLCILTLQFIPINYRQLILREVYDHTLPGGALIIVEKVLGDGSDVDREMVNLYHGFKQRSGYSADEVARKSMSLEGVLVPVTAAWNVDLMRQAGFDEIDCFWRWLNFAGWIAIKR